MGYNGVDSWRGRLGNLTVRVIIVRHGQSSYNIEQMIQGRCDVSVLTDKGRADALQVGAALRGIELDGFLCSPLKRARQTAETIHACLENPPALHSSDKLLEVDLPLWENLKKQEVQERFPQDYRLWKERPHEFRMIVPTDDGGQREHYPVLSLYEQARAFWQEILPQYQGKTVLVVAHNGINRCLIASAIGIHPSRYHVLQQSNCGINILKFSGGWGDSVQLESLNQTAHLEMPLPSPRKDSGVRLLLVRHGETQWNRESRFQGQIDVPLNEKGQEQGRLVAQFLKEVKLDFAVSSPMLRPKATAEAILQYHSDVALRLQSELKEISHGRWEGKLQAEILEEFGDLLQQWQNAPETVQMPEGENLQQVWNRAIACWENLVRDLSSSSSIQTGIVVAHDAINKVIVCHILGLTAANFWNIKQGNGAVSVIDYPEGLQGMPVLQSLNITSHLFAGQILDATAAGAL